MSAASNAELERAAAAISDAGEVALVCHVNPDGDALGSMLGLFHVLRAAAKPTIASFPSPFVVAPHYRNLPGLELITTSRTIATGRSTSLSRTRRRVAGSCCA